MKKYIGFKMIEAEPMTDDDFHNIPEENRGKEPTREGYKVKYSDDYISWSPKEVFESAYMQVGDNNTITKENVEQFIKEVQVSTIGDKTTLVRAILINGFELVEASACVDVANYDEKYGAEICLDKIKDKIWMLLGFLLQTAIKGIK